MTHDMRIAPDGGTANIGRAEYDDGSEVCARCGEEMGPNELSVEAWERFDEVMCPACFDAACESLEDEF